MVSAVEDTPSPRGSRGRRRIPQSAGPSAQYSTEVFQEPFDGQGKVSGGHRVTGALAAQTANGAVGRTVSDGIATANNQSPSRKKNNTQTRRNARSSPGRHSENETPPTHSRRSDNSATPAKAAYAGPTFHASPAPSSLPVPKFFSKSVPSVAADGLQARMEEEPDGYKKSLNLLDAQMAQRTIAEPSPLDIFFKAHREERTRSTSQPSTEPPRHHLRQKSDNMAKEMFMMELDGVAMESSSRASTVTPYKDRMRAAAIPYSKTPLDDPRRYEEQERRARSSALKEFLSGRPPARENFVHARQTQFTDGDSPFSDHLMSSHRPDMAPRSSTGLESSRSSLPPQHLHAQREPYYGNNVSPSAPHSKLQPTKQNDPAIYRSSSPRQNSGLHTEINPLYSTRQAPHSLSVSQYSGHASPSPSARADVPATCRDYLSSHLQAESPRSSVQAQTKTASPDIRSMEADLRRVLKLDATARP